MRGTIKLAMLLALGFGSVGLAQYALDANLDVRGNGRNAARPEPTMGTELYTVSRRTGQMVYNRANAFNDSTYQIYQRYTLDREQYFDPTRTSPSNAGTAAAVRKQQGPTNAVPRVARAQPVQTPGVTPQPRASRPPSLSQPVYSASRVSGAQPSSLQHSGYRASKTR
ncbi:MAG: hypothetical protein AAFX05_12340 [Planctomycetota bacterium]